MEYFAKDIIDDFIKEIKEDKSKIKKVIGVYGGRFQPFGPHHKKVYKWLKSQFDDAYITTSNIKQLPRHPMNFNEKVRHMTKMGIPSSKIIMEKSPFVAKNLMSKFDEETTAVVYIFGAKDKGRLSGGKYFQDYKRNKNNLKGHVEHGYVLVAPHMSVSAGGLEVSGTAMRELLGSPKYKDQREKLFKKMFGYYDKGLYMMMTNKFKKLYEGKDFEPEKEKKRDVLLDEGVKDKLKKVFIGIKKEMKQNKKLGKILTKYIKQGGKLSSSDTAFAKTQFLDSLKLVGLTGLVLVPFGKFSIPVLVKVAEMVGMDLLPSSFREVKLKEDIHLPVQIGDTVLMGKFKNKKVVVKKIEVNEKGDVLINGKMATKFRIWKKADSEETGIEHYDDDIKIEGVNEAFAVKGSKVEKFITGKNLTHKGKKYKEIDFETIKIDNVTKLITLRILAPKKLFGQETPVTFKTLRRGPFLKTDTSKKVNEMYRPKGIIKKNKKLKEFIDNWIEKVDIKKLLEASSVASSGGMDHVDSGPGAYIKRHPAYKRDAQKIAGKLGMEVVDYILGGHDDNDSNPIYPNGPVQAVSYYPAGAGATKTPNNQIDLWGTEAWNTWIKHMTKSAETIGFSIVDTLEYADWSHDLTDKESHEVSVEEEPKETDTNRKDITKIKGKKGIGDGMEMVDESTFSKNWWKEELLLTEGGAYGHMAHPFDDKDLKFSDLKKIITMGLGGTLNREDGVTEKLDGQNIMVSWKDGKLIAARNKGHIKNGGKTALDAKGIRLKFAGRGDIANAFNFAMTDLGKAIGSLSDKQKEKIFNNGYNFMNLEVMWPKSANVIDYDVATLVFHGALKYNDAGAVIGQVGGSARMLAGMIQQVNQHIQSKYSIGKPNFLSVPKHQDFGKMKDTFLGRLSKLQSEFGLGDSDTLGLYHQKWWEQFILKQLKNISPKVLKGLVKRWAFFDKSYKIPQIKKDLKEHDIFLQWVLDFDKQNHAAQVKKNMKPFEILFFQVGAEIMKNMSGFIAANPSKAVQGIKSRLDAAISSVRSGGDLKKLNKLKAQLEKLQAIGGMKAIVPSEGIVFKYKGKTYKFTGAFAPINQITGLMAF